MVTIVGNGKVDLCKILEEVVCISNSANILAKGMNPFIDSKVLGKYFTVSLFLVWQKNELSEIIYLS